MKKLMKAVAALMLMTAAVGCTKPDGPNNGGDNNDGTINGHAYVDLGLPSGTLWATCNVGADSPEDFGDYFAWGETQSKTIYDWSTYKYCSDGNHYHLLKYCNNSNFGYNGFTDNLLVLLESDDAAFFGWGNEWYIPKKEQWEELFQNTNSTWTTRNDVVGRLFTASNGNSLFLPAAGYFRNDSVLSSKIIGYYWSSLLFVENPSCAMDFYFDMVNCGKSSFYRYYGLPIRPVCSAE